MVLQVWTTVPGSKSQMIGEQKNGYVLFNIVQKFNLKINWIVDHTSFSKACKNLYVE